MKLKKWLQTNNLFLRVISVAVTGVILATILITWISIQTLQKNYLKTFRNANQIFTEQINTDMTEFYAETATVMQTGRESWAFRRYFGMLDMSTAEASYTIYSMKRQIDAIQSNQLKQTIRIIAIGRNGRYFISGDSSLSISQEEILNSTFTKSIREANGKPVVQYVENGLSTIAKGKGAYVIGSSLTYSNSTIPYGYVYAVIPLDTMSGFDIRYTGAASELFLLDTQGTVLAAPDTDLIGTKQPELLQSARKKTEKISYNGTTCSVVYSYQPQMHCYIMSLINQEQILKLLDSYIHTLEVMRTNIADADSPALLDAFTAAKDYRDSITITAKGALKNVYELYLDLIDETGGIATVATILASNNLSIKNIGIIHNREFEGGVLRLEMYDGESLALAVALLKKHHYTIYER